MSAFTQLLTAISIGSALFSVTAAAAFERKDFRVTTVDGVGIRVRAVKPTTAMEREPILLIHGARVPGIASFDLDAPNGSLAADLAGRLGRTVFVMDARGYGGSDRPAAMSRPASESRPLSRAHEVVRDIDAVAQAAMQRSGADKVTLLGWATGGMWAAYYASLWPDKVGHLITLNALYGGSNEHPTLGPGSANADREHSHRLSARVGGYALYDAASLTPSWDRSIPVEDKSTWRDPAVLEAYVQAALASDPLSSRHAPPVFRAPLGAIEDSFYQAGGRKLFDAGSITASVLIIRSSRDFWSRPADVDAFARDAGRARSVRVVTLPDATHYVHLDRPRHGRDRLLEEISDFLGVAAEN